jgi:3',5'-cyclic AMP phosphodiesterase CpdA
MNKFIRNNIILITLLLVLFSFTGCTFISRKSAKDSVQSSDKDKVIYITSDIHYLSDKLIDGGEAYTKFANSRDGKQLGYIDEIFDAFTYNIKNTKPDLLIISGDLTCNGEKESHLDLAEKLNTIEENGTSVYVIPGNHDVSNPWARGFKDTKQYKTESVDEKEFSEIYSDYGYDEAISRDEASLSYLAAPSEDVWLLMLDTNKYKKNYELGIPQVDGILAKATLDWIKTCTDLAKEKGAKIITVMHHNILNHSEVIQEGYTLNNNDQTRMLFQENNLNLIFSGHIHVQDITSDRKSSTPLYDIASNALSVYPHQYGVLNYSAKEVTMDYSTAKVDVERWAKRERSKDKNLKNFNQYSEDYFGKFAYERAYETLLNETDASPDEINSISETIRLLNIRYFSGTEHLNSEDVIDSEGYQLLMGLTKTFLQSYADSILNDYDTDDNKLHIILNNSESEKKE